jgi:hypothetical protein
MLNFYLNLLFFKPNDIAVVIVFDGADKIDESVSNYVANGLDKFYDIPKE